LQSWREEDLEVAPGELGAGGVGAQGLLEFRRSAVAAVGSGQGIEGGVVGQLAALHFVEQVLQVALGQALGQVEDRSCDGGDGDAVAGGDLGLGQVA
jgi:hypothetical protein